MISKVLVVQLLATGLYLFIALAESIVVGILQDPNGFWMASSVSSYFSLFQSLTLGTLSALYTLSMFEVLIFANIVMIYQSRPRVKM